MLCNIKINCLLKINFMNSHNFANKKNVFLQIKKKDIHLPNLNYKNSNSLNIYNLIDKNNKYTQDKGQIQFW